jgi:hypothetical protein
MSSSSDDGFSMRGTRAEIQEPELMENKGRVKQIKRAGRFGRVGWFPFVFTQDLIEDAAWSGLWSAADGERGRPLEAAENYIASAVSWRRGVFDRLMETCVR